MTHWYAPEDFEPGMMVSVPSSTVNCRAGLDPRCYDGMPEARVYEDGQAEDGTWDGSSIVCDPCYIRLGCPPNPVLRRPE